MVISDAMLKSTENWKLYYFKKHSEKAVIERCLYEFTDSEEEYYLYLDIFGAQGGSIDSNGVPTAYTEIFLRNGLLEVTDKNPLFTTGDDHNEDNWLHSIVEEDDSSFLFHQTQVTDTNPLFTTGDDHNEDNWLHSIVEEEDSSFPFHGTQVINTNPGFTTRSDHNEDNWPNDIFLEAVGKSSLLTIVTRLLRTTRDEHTEDNWLHFIVKKADSSFPFHRTRVADTNPCFTSGDDHNEDNWPNVSLIFHQTQDRFLFSQVCYGHLLESGGEESMELDIRSTLQKNPPMSLLPISLPSTSNLLQTVVMIFIPYQNLRKFLFNREHENLLLLIMTESVRLKNVPHFIKQPGHIEQLQPERKKENRINRYAASRKDFCDKINKK